MKMTEEEINEKETYRLWWDYLERSKAYKLYLEWWGKDVCLDISPEEIDQIERIEGNLSDLSFFFGDVHNTEFEDWWQKFSMPAKELKNKNRLNNFLPIGIRLNEGLDKRIKDLNKKALSRRLKKRPLNEKEKFDQHTEGLELAAWEIWKQCEEEDRFLSFPGQSLNEYLDKRWKEFRAGLKKKPPEEKLERDELYLELLQWLQEWQCERTHRVALKSEYEKLREKRGHIHNHKFGSIFPVFLESIYEKTSKEKGSEPTKEEIIEGMKPLWSWNKFCFVVVDPEDPLGEIVEDFKAYLKPMREDLKNINLMAQRWYRLRPTVNKVKCKDFKRYLRVYDKWSENPLPSRDFVKKYGTEGERAIIEEMESLSKKKWISEAYYDLERKVKNIERPYERDFQIAKEIIENVEHGYFPGPYGVQTREEREQRNVMLEESERSARGPVPKSPEPSEDLADGLAAVVIQDIKRRFSPKKG